METNIIITFLACIIIISIFGKFLFLPLKKIMKLVANSILGGLSIYVINLIGSPFDFHIGINIVTAVFVRCIRNSRSNFIGDFQVDIGIKLEKIE